MTDNEKTRIASAIDLLAAMVVEQLAQEDHRDPTDVFPEFMASQTAQMLYDEETKLWWDGPATVVRTYRDEKAHKPAIRFKGFTDPWEQRKF